MSAQFCVACHGINLTELDGAVVCNDCGTQAQVHIEESEFQDVGGQGTSRRRINLAQHQAGVVLPEGARPEDVGRQLQQQASAYLHCLQALLQEQCACLPGLLGVIPEVQVLVRNLWFLLLPHTELLDMSTSYSAQTTSHPGDASGTQGGGAGLEGDDDDDDDDMDVEEEEDGEGDEEEVEEEEQEAVKGGGRGAQQGPRFVFHYNGRYIRKVAYSQSRRQRGVQRPQRQPGGEEGEEGEGEGGARSDDSDDGDGGDGGDEGPGGRRGEGSEERSEQQQLNDKLVFIGKSHVRTANMLSGELHPQITLIIIFLACVALQQPVSPSHVVRAALDGRLPFLRAPAKCCSYLSSLAPVISAPVQQLLQPAGCCSPSELQAAALELAALLDLRLPAVNAPLLLFRATQDLALPEVVWVVCHALCCLYLHDTPLLCLGSTSKAHSPYSLLAALLVTAAYLCYGLDGRDGGAARLPGVPPPPPAVAPALQQQPRVAGTEGQQDAIMQQQQQQQQPDGTQEQQQHRLGQQQPEGAHPQQQHQHQQPQQHQLHQQGQQQLLLHQQQQQQAAGPALLLDRLRQAEQQAGLSIADQFAVRAGALQQARLQQSQAGVAGSHPGWQAWGQARLEEFGSLQSWPTSAIKAAQLQGPELLSYLHFLRTHLANPHTLPPGLLHLDTWLQDLGPALLRQQQPQQLDTTAAAAGAAATGATAGGGAGGSAGARWAPGAAAAAVAGSSQEALGGGSQPEDEMVFGSQGMFMATQEWGFEQATRHQFVAGNTNQGLAAAGAAGAQVVSLGQGAGPPSLSGMVAGSGPGRQGQVGLMGTSGAGQHVEGTQPGPSGRADEGAVVGAACGGAVAGVLASARDPHVYAHLPEAGGGVGPSLHPDLMAVVCACAAYVNVQPSSLVQAVALLQKHMCTAEARGAA